MSDTTLTGEFADAGFRARGIDPVTVSWQGVVREASPGERHSRFVVDTRNAPRDAGHSRATVVRL